MDLYLGFAFLAWVRAEPDMVTPDFPPAPSISLTPRYPVYVKGEPVTVTCSAPRASVVKGFRYYKEGKGFISETLESRSNDSHEISTSDPEAGGSYSCVYFIKTSGREIQSSESANVLISVTDVPPAPYISLTPRYPVYIRGESVTATCSAPGGSVVKRFRYYKEGKGIISENITSWSRDTHEISTSDPESGGSYRCVYLIETSGREIPSLESDQVLIPVTDVPPAPAISLTPPNPVYIRGESVNLNCSAPKGSEVRGFQYFKKMEEEWIIVTSQGRDSHRISTSDPEAAGSYSCVYWIETSGREIQSKLSIAMSIILIDAPPAPSISLTPPYPVYIRGESVSVTCSAPGGYRVRGFHYHKEGKINIPQTITSESRHSQEISTSDPEAAGSYSCEYWIKTSGRRITSKKSVTVSISVAEVPPAACLTLESPWPVYITGENVSLLCSAPEAFTAKKFQIFQEKKEVVSVKVLAQKSLAHSLSGVNQNSGGSYTCYYWTMEKGREIRSRPSDPITVSVTDRPEPPSILLTPQHHVYLADEAVMLVCVPPAGYRISGYQLYRNRQPMDWQASSERYLHFSVLPVQRGSSESYTCGYWTKKLGRSMVSQLSHQVRVSVVSPPRRPTISLTPDFREYITGDVLQIGCTAPWDVSARGYALYAGSLKLANESAQDPPWDIHLRAPGDGKSIEFYSCTYQADVDNRTLQSANSERRSVAVSPAPESPTIGILPRHPVYVKGEAVKAWCSAPREHRPKEYRIQRGRAASPVAGSPQQLEMDRNASYTCAYRVDLPGRQIDSPASEAVWLSVIDPLPRALLILDPPGPVVHAGERVLLACLAPTGAAGPRRFHFYKDNQDYAPAGHNGTAGINFSATTAIDSMEASSAARYACSYEEEVDGRWIPAARSKTHTLSLPDTLGLVLKVLSGSLAAVILLICLGLLAHWVTSINNGPDDVRGYLTRRASSFYWKTRKDKSSAESVRDVQPAVLAHGAGDLCRAPSVALEIQEYQGETTDPEFLSFSTFHTSAF